MSSTPPPPQPPVAEGAQGRSWRERRLRAESLLAADPTSEQMLKFYLRLLQLQEPLYNETLRNDWLTGVESPGPETFPVLQLDRLPFAELLEPFRRFVDDVGPAATEVLARVAESLAWAGDETLAGVIRDFALGQELDATAGALNCDPPQLEFFARAFLAPIAEGLAEQANRTTTDWCGSTCPICGWLPQVSVLRDDPEVKGQRLLVCSLCGTRWPFARLTCAQCGESDPEKLIYHESDSTPHVRVEECKTCRAYLKSVDLRKDGTAVPIVEDLASVELDVWCDEQRLTKIQPNLLGM